MLTRLPLHDAKWTVRAVGDLSRIPAEVLSRVVAGIPATLLEEVGGCIHTDLMDAGIIPDPAVGMNEPAVEWVSWTDWCYEADFNPSSPAPGGGGGRGSGGGARPEGEVGTTPRSETPTGEPPLLTHHQLDLCFDSLDTLAVIELNGAEVGRANSEFLPWRFNITGLLTPGVNRLRITFTSPLRHVYALAEAHGRPYNGDESTPKWHPYNLMRKCASNFGWDWGPRVPTCGIGGGVRVEGWSVARLESVESWFDHAMGMHAINVIARFPPPHPARGVVLRCRLEGPGGVPQGTWSFESEPEDAQDEYAGGGYRVPVKMQPWKPTGHGEANLVTLEIVVECAGSILDRWTGRVARQPELLTEPWAHRDRKLPMTVDGQPVLCKGANWIPEGLWPRDRTAARVRERLGQAKAAGMNMVRVWGGGRYESEAFYDACDELGIMVWQDFMFACALYPEEEPWRTLVEQEARYQVARLSRHPCIVLWCGGNENHWAYESWGFKQRLRPGQTWGKGYWQDLLPRIVAELSPHTPYVPDSPWSPPPAHPNDAGTGDRHTWDVFGEDFRAVVPRFCSEFGVQSPSCLETLREARLSEPDAPARGTTGGGSAPAVGSDAASGAGAQSLAGASGSDRLPRALIARQRGPGGMKRWYDEFFAKAGVAAPGTFAEWHAAAQKLQADWLYLAVVWLRANWPRCAGSLIWQLNDAWPGLSWSLIDSAGREKPAYHAVARAYADRLVEVVPFEGVPHRVAINDTEEPWEVEPGWVVEPRSVSKRPV